MGKEHTPPHRNKWTGEMLRNKEQVCPACHLNFATTEDGDAHRIGLFGVDRRCAHPEEAGLDLEMNRFGTGVWRAR